MPSLALCKPHHKSYKIPPKLPIDSGDIQLLHPGPDDFHTMKTLMNTAIWNDYNILPMYKIVRVVHLKSRKEESVHYLALEVVPSLDHDASEGTVYVHITRTIRRNCTEDNLPSQYLFYRRNRCPLSMCWT
jgi:hypothetical protein